MEKKKDYNAENIDSNVVIKNRENISFSGVNDVGDFTEEQVALFTVKGSCTVKGKGLKVQKLDLEEGNVIVEGNIVAIVYNDRKSKDNISLMKRIFR